MPADVGPCRQCHDELSIVENMAIGAPIASPSCPSKKLFLVPVLHFESRWMSGNDGGAVQWSRYQYSVFGIKRCRNIFQFKFPFPV